MEIDGKVSTDVDGSAIALADAGQSGGLAQELKEIAQAMNGEIPAGNAITGRSLSLELQASATAVNPEAAA